MVAVVRAVVAKVEGWEAVMAVEVMAAAMAAVRVAVGRVVVV